MRAQWTSNTRYSVTNSDLYELICLSGMTETFTTVSVSPNDQKIATPGSAGVLIPGMVARVVKPDGSLGKVGESGELVVTGPSMALGYYKNPEA